MKRKEFGSSMEYVKAIIGKWNYKLKRKYWDNGYYTFLITEEENSIYEEVKVFIESAMKRGKYIVNILDNTIEYDSIFFTDFIIIKEYNSKNGEMLVLFIDKHSICREKYISIHEYLEINKLINCRRFISFNVLTLF